MSYCPKCGKEISDSAIFCGNCGKQINRITEKDKHSKKIFYEDFDFKCTLSKIKEYFIHFYVDFNSKFFNFALVLFLALGMGKSIYSLVYKALPQKAFELFSGAQKLYELLICSLLFGVFSVLIPKIKSKQNIRKSNFLIIIWIVMIGLNFLNFLAGYELYDYVLFDEYAEIIIKLLTVVFTALLLYKNKPRNPIFIIISSFSFALSISSISNIQMSINFYNIDKHLGLDSADTIFYVIYCLRYIILVAVLFLLVYLIPRKISKWLVFFSSLSVIVLSVIEEVINNSAFIYIILNLILETGIVAMFVLFALSCSRKIEYIIENKVIAQICALKIGIISTSSIAIIVIAYLLISAIVCSMQINSGIKKWKTEIINGELTDSDQWNLMEEDIFKYTCDKFVSSFVYDYSFYKTLKEERRSMKRISLCYSAYKNGNVDVVQEYSWMSVDESWANNSVLSSYYKKYKEMQPNIENVSVQAKVDVKNGEIEITVTNNNLMPISKCTVQCSFTILYIEPGMYSSNEYGRGTKTIVIEDIDGCAKKTETIFFDPDDYYDSYGSYMMASVVDNSARVIDIE